MIRVIIVLLVNRLLDLIYSIYVILIIMSLSNIKSKIYKCEFIEIESPINFKHIEAQLHELFADDIKNKKITRHPLLLKEQGGYPPK